MSHQTKVRVRHLLYTLTSLAAIALTLAAGNRWKG